MGYGQKTLKDIVQKGEEEEQQQEEDVDLTSHEHERALKGLSFDDAFQVCLCLLSRLPIITHISGSD